MTNGRRKALFTTYTLLKFLHVVAVIIWLGGITLITLLNARLVSSRDRSVALTLAKQNQQLGLRIIGPAAGVTLLAGIGTAWSAGMDFGAIWISWGFIAIFASLAFGATLIRSTMTKFQQHLEKQVEDGVLGSVQRRLTLFSVLNLLLLFSAVAVMVFKPN